MLCRRALFFILGTVSVAQAGPDPAEDLLAAHRAGDPAAIGRIARTLQQDPWPIALELLARRAPAAAAAFAQALPKNPDLAGLGAWVEAARVRKDLVGGYALLGELRAEAREQKFADLVRRTDELSGGDPVLDSMLLLLRAAALAELGRWPESLACHKAAAVRADSVGWLRGAAGSLAAGAGRARAAADHRAAIDIQNRLRAIHVRRGDRMAAAIALANRATHHLRLGDYRPARALLREAIPVFEQHHATGPAAIAHSNLGLLLGLSGEYAAAFRHTERALAMRRKAGDVRGVMLVRGYLATLYARAGETDRALQTYGQVLAEHNERGDRARAAEVLGNRGIAHQARGDFSNALTDYRAAEALFVQLEDKSNARRARSNVAYVLGRNSEPEAALRIFERVLKEARLESDLGGVVTALEEIAQLQGVAGNWSAAASRYRAAVEAARGIGWRERTVRALQGLAQAVLNGGDAQEALRTARVAREEMQFLVGGLDDGLGATARAPRAGTLPRLSARASGRRPGTRTDRRRAGLCRAP